MTPAEFQTARRALGLTQAQLAQVMGFSSVSTIRRQEVGETDNPAAARLMAAYLSGYRPDDWPTPRRRKVGAV